MVAKLRNSGSACTAANRFIVDESIADDFAARLAQAMSTLTVGPGMDPGTDIGPLVNSKTREKVSHLVDDALASGAKALVGADAPPRRGFYYLPTVLAAVPRDAQILGDAYRFCEAARNRLYLVRGAAGDSLPSTGPVLTHLARSLSTTPTSLREEYRRLTRRSRQVMERRFYGRL